MQVLVIGGTGPTGPFVVNGLVERGHEVVILHSGRHEVDTIPDHVEHIHTDAFDIDAIDGALGERRFEAVFAMYGRLRDLAPYFVGRTGRFLSIGGVPAYHGFNTPDVWSPPGLPIPTSEDGPLAGPDENDKVVKIVATERLVFEHHPGATHFRYPRIYGPGQILPREWIVIRRILDGRRTFILADEGLSILSSAYAANAGAAILAAFDRPEAAMGEVFNIVDEHALTARQVVEVIAATMGADLEIVSLPWELATPAHPFMDCGTPHHRMVSVEKLHRLLDYRDALPAPEAMAATTRWLLDHPIERGSVTEQGLGDPFDYEAEDRLLDAWRTAVATVQPAAEAARTGYVDRYARTSVGAHLKIER